MASPAPRILLVEDDVRTAKSVRLYLESAGFEVQYAATGTEALALTRDESFDLAILDILLPGVDGWTLCRRLRRSTDAGVIMVSALSTLDDKIEGLELGADDYLTKPFSPRELVARARSVLRRRAGRSRRILERGELRLDRDRGRAFRGETELDLTPSEFDLLEIFLAAPGRLFERSELVDRLAGDCTERTVDSHVANLRRKLDPADVQRFVETVYGRGYRLRERPP